MGADDQNRISHPRRIGEGHGERIRTQVRQTILLEYPLELIKAAPSSDMVVPLTPDLERKVRAYYDNF